MAPHHHSSRRFLLLATLAIFLTILAFEMESVEGARRKKVKEEDRQRERGNTMDKVEELEGKKQPPKKEEEKKSEEKEEGKEGGGRRKRQESEEGVNHRHRRHHRAVGEKGKEIDEEMAKELLKEGKQKSLAISIAGGFRSKDRPLPLPLPETRLENLARAMREAGQKN